jgi:hypothetical protein
MDQKGIQITKEGDQMFNPQNKDQILNNTMDGYVSPVN